jgi:beta-lysine 5,6-aminomutase beta subunit
MVQVSFTLPVAHDKRAEGAALQLAAKMGLDPAMLVHARQMGTGFTFFVVYGRVTHLVDLDAVTVLERDYPLLAAKEINSTVRSRLRRKLVVVGACIGTDAHTVGIDAILNVKGVAGDKGLEYYRELRVVNLGAQVTVPELVASARAEKADAVLVSQVVTQKDAHLPTPGRCPPRSASRIRRASGRCSSSAARASTRRWPATSASTGSSAAAPRRARWPSYLVHALGGKR